MVETLEKDRQTAQKNIAQREFEQSMAAGRLGSAAHLSNHLLTLETDANEVAALHKVRDAIAAKRRSNKNKYGVGVPQRLSYSLLIAANQDNHPSSPPTSIEPPSAIRQIQPSVSAPESTPRQLLATVRMIHQQSAPDFI